MNNFSEAKCQFNSRMNILEYTSSVSETPIKEHVSKQEAFSGSYKQACFIMVRNAGFQNGMLPLEINNMFEG